MDILKQITDALVKLPKIVGQLEIVYKILKKAVPLIKAFSSTYQAPQLDPIVEPLEKVLDFMEKVAPLFGIRLPVEQQIVGQSVESTKAQFDALLTRYDELDQEVDL
jgi:hypothetical protein